MPTSKAILMSVVCIVSTVAIGLALLFSLGNPSSPGATDRASQLGGALGVFCAIEVAVIWVVWAAKRRGGM